MRMADTPEARKDLDSARCSLYATYNKIFIDSLRLSHDVQFELIWSSACEINRLLGKHSVASVKMDQAEKLQTEVRGQHYDATILDDVVNDSNKPYKGSDSVPF